MESAGRARSDRHYSFRSAFPRGLKSRGASSAEEPPVALTATDQRGVRAADSHHGASVSLCLDGRVGAVRAPATLALTACGAWSASMRPAVSSPLALLSAPAAWPDARRPARLTGDAGLLAAHDHRSQGPRAPSGACGGTPRRRAA